MSKILFDWIDLSDDEATVFYANNEEYFKILPEHRLTSQIPLKREKSKMEITTRIHDREIDPKMISTIVWHKTIEDHIELPFPLGKTVLLVLSSGIIFIGDLIVNENGAYRFEDILEEVEYPIKEISYWAELPAVPDEDD